MKHRGKKICLLLLSLCFSTSFMTSTARAGEFDSNYVNGVAKNPTNIILQQPEDNVQVATDNEQEMRAAWVATVWNIDWPSKTDLSSDSQKTEFIALLDNAKAMGVNTLMVQIRPTADAFYPSEYYPWSQFLTGTQGKSPQYDPVQFMIAEAAKRNIKIYAWFNPFRICTSETGYKALDSSNPALVHPEWVVSCSGGGRFFNPGVPEARQYIIDGILEVVKKYNIAGVILDDYFYPYPSSDTAFSDDDTYNTYGQSFSDKGDWRRNNVNCFLYDLHKSIKEAKPEVNFGVSPFGIWRNKLQDSNGSDTNGLSSYDAIYTDSRKWVKDGYIDFISPQIYWPIGYGAADYKTLVNWWADQVKDTNVKLYVSQAAYMVGKSSPAAWMNPDEYKNEMLYNKQIPEVKGTIHYSISSLIQDKLNIKETLQNEIYTK